MCNAIANLGWTIVLPLGLLPPNEQRKKNRISSCQLALWSCNVLKCQHGLDQWNWGGSISVMILLCVSYKKCSNVYAPSDTSINNIYDRNASCHFWCCKRIYLSFPLWYNTSFSHVVWEYLISLNAIQKNLLYNKTTYFTIYCRLTNFASVWVMPFCFQRLQGLTSWTTTNLFNGASSGKCILKIFDKL